MRRPRRRLLNWCSARSSPLAADYGDSMPNTTPASNESRLWLCGWLLLDAVASRKNRPRKIALATGASPSNDKRLVSSNSVSGSGRQALRRTLRHTASPCAMPKFVWEAHACMREVDGRSVVAKLKLVSDLTHGCRTELLMTRHYTVTTDEPSPASFSVCVAAFHTRVAMVCSMCVGCPSRLPSNPLCKRHESPSHQPAGLATC